MGGSVPRSGILATMLLASGVPARVVQLVGPGFGHTVVEVWDYGWRLYDPMLAGAFGDASSLLGAADLATARTLGLVELGTRPAGTFPATKIFGDQARLQAVTILYPEPYLYLRSGRRVASFPYRGAFATVERPGSVLGPGQRLAVSFVLGFLGMGAMVLLVGAVDARRRQTPEPTRAVGGHVSASSLLADRLQPEKAAPGRSVTTGTQARSRTGGGLRHGESLIP